METRNTGHAVTQGINFLPVTATTLVRFRDSRLLFNKVLLGLVSSAYYSFPLPISFQQCSKLIYLSPTIYGLSSR